MAESARFIPRVSSLLQLTLLSLALVLVPPAVAVGTAFVAVEQLARSGEEAALAAGETVGLARDLTESATAMERHARQRAILQDDAFLEPYEARRSGFVTTLARLSALDLPPTIRAQVGALAREEAAIHQALTSRPPGDARAAAALDGLGALSAGAREVMSASTQMIATTARELHTDAEQLESRLFSRAAWAVPLLIGTLALVLVAIVRPLRSLDEAIRRIGAGDLDVPITIRGPSDLRGLGERLEWLRQRLLALESDRMRLFRHVSHELKTPLASMREGSQLLADEVTGPLAAEQREIVDILRENTAQLHQRIEDLLRLGELRTEAAAPVFHPMEFDALVHEVLIRHQVAARGRKLEFETRLSPTALRGDAPRLATVVDNLVGNAVKFSPVNGRIRVTLVHEGNEARLDVADDGPGVDPEEQDRIFEAFYQGRASRDFHVRGTGIGLTLARDYARAHGGELTVVQGETGGWFRLRLPLRVEALG